MGFLDNIFGKNKKSNENVADLYFEHNLKAFTGYDNVGTRLDTFTKASGYWSARMSKIKKRSFCFI